MGEWVSAMAGRGEGGARPPTEEEISSCALPHSMKQDAR